MRRLFQTCSFALGFNRQSDFPGAQQRFANISVFRTAVERDQPVAVRAIGLKPVADPVRALAKYLRAFRALDFDFFIDHEMLPNSKNAVCDPRLNGWFEGSLKLS
ncbi:hypothetical protein [Bradyrhizobium sp.]|uniref:hypothetical protein n=1 Tax=Bradyrhizobium sp. TaxID=376 RepID=UPI003C7293C0